jgi:hypothetical protein
MNNDKIRKMNARILHEGHLAYQRSELAFRKIQFGDSCDIKTRKIIHTNMLAIPSIRGEHFVPKPRVFKEHWLKKSASPEWNVRPNFWKAFEQTELFMRTR